jgi:hypothetical protein
VIESNYEIRFTMREFKFYATLVQHTGNSNARVDFGPFESQKDAEIVISALKFVVNIAEGLISGSVV